MNQIKKSNAGRPDSKEQITLFDRFALAFAGAFFAFLTIVAYLLIGPLLGVPKLSGIMMKFALSPLGLIYIGTFTVLGFALGPTRLANLFSFAWGTHPSFESEKNKVVGTVLVALLIVVLLRLYFF